MGHIALLIHEYDNSKIQRPGVQFEENYFKARIQGYDTKKFQ